VLFWDGVDAMVRRARREMGRMRVAIVKMWLKLVVVELREFD
jgi:hypothetical protein